MLQVRLTDARELARIAPLKKQIHALHVAGRPDLFAPLEDLSAFEDFAMGEGMRLFLAEQDGAVVGYALARPVDRQANPYMRRRFFFHVEEICVDEAFQRQGVGRALMDAVRREAEAAGCPRVVLDVWTFNENARRFYESIGFRPFQTFLEMNAEEESR